MRSAASTLSASLRPLSSFSRQTSRNFLASVSWKCLQSGKHQKETHLEDRIEYQESEMTLQNSKRQLDEIFAKLQTGEIGLDFYCRLCYPLTFFQPATYLI